MREPPYDRPFPVSTPMGLIAEFAVHSVRVAISRPPTPMSPAGTSQS